jgi:hypothetical protein
MRVRQFLLGAAIVALFARCGLDRASDVSGTPAVLRLALRGELPLHYQAFATNLVIEQVRLALVRRPSDTLATVTRPLPLDSASVRFNVAVALTSQAESLLAVLQYQTAQGVTLFSGQVVIEASVNPPVANTPSVPLTYTGPGGNIAFINLSPLDSVLSAGDSLEFLASAIDSNQQPVPNFYASWSTSDSRVTINALGLVRAPDLTKKVDVTAVTPNGSFAQTTLTIQGTFALGISPDSVEKLPGGQQQFSVSVGPGRVSYTWSVNGVDGGNATFGTIDSTGFYTAPSVVPNPATFQVCARVTAAPTLQNGCATVVMTSIPTAGGDVIVFNDINMFTTYPTLPGNTRLVRNLVNFTSSGPRNSGNTVLFDYTHAARCNIVSPFDCSFASTGPLRTIITGQGKVVDTLPTSTLITSLPPSVKVVFIWTPQIAYDTTEINAYKQFAAQGGRIVFFGERLPYYGSFGIDSVENRFFREMGAQLVNVGADVALASPYMVPIPGSGRHQIMTGVDSVGFDAASVILPGPNDFILVADTMASANVLGAVAKIDLTPLPVVPGRVAVRAYGAGGGARMMPSSPSSAAAAPKSSRESRRINRSAAP